MKILLTLTLIVGMILAGLTAAFLVDAIYLVPTGGVFMFVPEALSEVQ